MKEDKEEVVGHLRSKIFPWNFILEDVDGEAVRHFVPYAIQMCEAKGIERGSVEGDAVRDVITREIKEAVEDYLFDPDDEEISRMHGQFAEQYPFAFSQSLAFVILQRLGLNLDDIVDVRGVSDLLGVDLRVIREREDMIQNIIAKTGGRTMKMFARTIIDKKVITAGGDWIGTVADISFTRETGKVADLIITHLRGSGLKTSRIPMKDARLNMYSKNIVLKSSDYRKGG
ncbi:MAG: PRC-barrel domain-containing protein [Candidatus Methanospirareceae archaeon]